MVEVEEEQRVKKRKKYLRDLEDYKSNSVFKWQELYQDAYTPVVDGMLGVSVDTNTGGFQPPLPGIPGWSNFHKVLLNPQSWDPERWRRMYTTKTQETHHFGSE